MGCFQADTEPVNDDASLRANAATATATLAGDLQVPRDLGRGRGNTAKWRIKPFRQMCDLVSSQ